MTGINPVLAAEYRANAGCDGAVNVADAFYLIGFVFNKGGPGPCDPDNNGQTDCQRISHLFALLEENVRGNRRGV